MSANTQIQQYFDALIAAYDQAASAAREASDRGIKISGRIAEEIGAGQREALEFSKKLAAEPTNFGLVTTALLEASVAAQGRALALAQLAYQEALSANAGARKILDQLIASHRSLAEAAVALSTAWIGQGPLAEAWQEGLKAFSAVGGAPKAEAAAAKARA